MKHIIRRLLALGTAAAMMGCGSAAFAAEEPSIAVQLDGKNLSFTDAVPQVKDQRTFLPFRAVFEAMGAEVSNQGNEITAVRGGKTLTMTIGSAEAKIAESGMETSITMDVAPYVDAATWRTYVPVRFAAQAFGCAVGWDQAAMTAVIVDTDKLLEEAKAGKSFTYLDKFMAYSEQYSTGTWDEELTFDGSMSILGSPISLKGTADATTADCVKMDMGMKMTLDMAQFLTDMAQASGEDPTLDAETQALLDSLAKDGVSLSMRGDLSQGKLYMNMTGDFFTAAGMDPAVWYSMDLASLYEGSGVDFTQLISLSKSMDYEALLKLILQSVSVDSVDAYAELKTAAAQAAALLSDSSFTKSGNDCITSFALDEEGTSLKLALTLTMAGDAVTSYRMECSMSTPADEAAQTPGVTMSITAGMDAKDQMNATVVMDMSGMIGMELNFSGSYTKSSKTPQLLPPDGAVVVPFESMLES